MVKILIADSVDLSDADKLLSKKFLLKNAVRLSNEEILKHYKDFDVLVIRSTRKINADFISKCNFRIIATCTTGTDHIDTEAAKKYGVRIISSDGANALSAAEHTIALMLSIEKRINYSDKLVRENKFGYYDYERREVAGKKIGIVGFGRVGSKVGKICKALGMKVYANDINKKVKKKNRSFEFRRLEYILKNCDILSIHIPLNKSNYKFFSRNRLMKASKNMILINTARGDVIDEEVLLGMLENRTIGFAGLDVFSGEPGINKRFFKLNNVVLTNHIAGKTIESRKRISGEIFLKLKRIYRD